MNIVEVMQRFPDQEACISHLEKVRWGNEPSCPHCESERVVRRADGAGKWRCNECKKSFTVTYGTMFYRSKIELQKWFLVIVMMTHAKKGISSHQLARDLSINQKTVWFMMMRIRSEMANEDDTLLQGIVEADETYIGPKPRGHKNKEKLEVNKRGRGTKKTAIIGAVQRGGRVVAKIATELTSDFLGNFIRDHVNPAETELVTDEFRSYNAIGSEMKKHSVIKHKEAYVEDDIHTNTIEGFWCLLKRARYGTHHHYKTAYLPLYLAEACYKYNNRNQRSIFDVFMKECMAT